MTQRRTLLLVFWLTIIAAIAAWVWLQDARIADLAERCDGQRFPIEIVQGGTAPYTTLTAGAERGAFLLDYGATASTVSAERFGNRRAGGTVSNFDLPSFPPARFRLARYWTAHAAPGGQLGLIGTDFLSLVTAKFSYRSSPYNADIMTRRELVPIRQTGVFSSNPTPLAPVRPNVSYLSEARRGLSLGPDQHRLRRPRTQPIHRHQRSALQKTNRTRRNADCRRHNPRVGLRRQRNGPLLPDTRSVGRHRNRHKRTHVRPGRSGPKVGNVLWRHRHARRTGRADRDISSQAARRGRIRPS
jgi:hypothetical protein